MTNSQVLAAQPKDGAFSFVFSAPAESSAANLSLLALTIFSGGYLDHDTPGIHVSSCVMKASWPMTRYSHTIDFTAGTVNTDLQLQSHNFHSQTKQMDDFFPTFKWHKPVLTINPEWVTNLRFDMYQYQNDSITAIEAIGATFASRYYTQFLNGIGVIGLTLASLVANSMSSFGFHDPAAVVGPDSCLANDQYHTNAGCLSIRYYIDGKGYTLNTWAVILATTILILYCLITLVFIAFSLKLGISSTAWDSASEIAALALYSKVPESSWHMSAGLRTLNVYRKKVAMMENEDRNLELVFREELREEEMGYEDVKFNDYY
jgi:hypothetical protein